MKKPPVGSHSRAKQLPPRAKISYIHAPCDQHENHYTGRENICQQKYYICLTCPSPRPPAQESATPAQPAQQATHTTTPPIYTQKKEPLLWARRAEQLSQQGFPDNSCHRDSQHRRGTQKAHYGRCMTSAPQRAEISSVPSHYCAAGRFERTARDEIYTYGKRMSRTT